MPTGGAGCGIRSSRPPAGPLRPPRGWRQPPLTIRGQSDPRLIERFPIPQLAGHLAMALVERFAVVGIQAQAHLRAVTRNNLAEPIGIGKRLPRETDDVGLLPGKTRLGLLKAVDATG